MCLVGKSETCVTSNLFIDFSKLELFDEVRRTKVVISRCLMFSVSHTSEVEKTNSFDLSIFDFIISFVYLFIFILFYFFFDNTAAVHRVISLPPPTIGGKHWRSACQHAWNQLRHILCFWQPIMSLKAGLCSVQQRQKPMMIFCNLTSIKSHKIRLH